MAGVENLKVVIKSGAKLVKTGIKVLADGKIGLSDLLLIGSALSSIQALGSLDFKSLLPEVTDLSLEEAQELVSVLIAELKA
jgi:hypothetical protein